MKAQGCPLLLVEETWESTAPTPTTEASASTMNCRAGSDWMSVVAAVKQAFRSWKVHSTARFQMNLQAEDIRVIRGAATEP